MMQLEKSKRCCKSKYVGQLNINKNKRVFEVVQAIGKSDSLKNAIIYHVIGSKENVEYINQIEYLINKYDLHNTVKLIDT